MKKLFSIALAIATFGAGQVMADPPHWAPAYGYDKHHDRDDYDRDDHHRHHRDHDDYDYYRYPRYRGHNQRIMLPLFESRPHVEVSCNNGGSIMGTIIGGATGGLVGNQFGKGKGNAAATIGGIIFGAMVGDTVGRSMDNCAAQALEYARTGTQVAWQNPDSGSAYSIVPVETYQRHGRYCREYQTRMNIGGQIEEGYGTACRQPDGSWKIVK